MDGAEITNLDNLEADYKDMIAALVAEGAQFLLVGGYAVSVHGYQRTTNDIDFFVRPTPENAARVIRALEKFGAPLLNISAEDFEKEGTVFQIGVAPIRIDILTSIAETSFEEAYQNAKIAAVDGVKFPVIPLLDLIRNKKAAGRGKDMVDVEHLEAILKKNST